MRSNSWRISAVQVCALANNFDCYTSFGHSVECDTLHGRNRYRR
ncbi:hypothetical protein RSAG8_07756, partial [Rhizoctonia solani AG-8 WAC10335]